MGCRRLTPHARAAHPRSIIRLPSPPKVCTQTSDMPSESGSGRAHRACVLLASHADATSRLSARSIALPSFSFFAFLGRQPLAMQRRVQRWAVKEAGVGQAIGGG
eukprot:459920-Rhodomonas_salina.1